MLPKLRLPNGLILKVMLIEMKDEETDLAILITNLKGKKKKDWFNTATSCRRLIKRYDNSYQKVAEVVGVSAEIIREVDSINDLPGKVKKMLLSEGKGLDKAYRISTMIKDKDKQIKIAQAVASLGAHEARKVIEYAIQNPKMPIEKCKHRVLTSKTVVKKVYAIVLPLDQNSFEKLKKKSKELETTPGDLAKKIVENWIRKK